MSNDSSSKLKRTQKLILPGLQLKLSIWFAGVCATGLVLQFILIVGVLTRVALELPGESGANLELVTGEALHVLLVSLAIVLPLVLALGILQTFKFAGPLHRMARFLEEIRDGAAPPDCQLRKGDELQGFCRLLNEATATTRAAARARVADQAGSSTIERAAA